MHPLRKRRLLTIVFVLSGIAIAAGCLLYALSQNINLYLTPSEITDHHAELKSLRIGGLVKKDSVHQSKTSLQISFVVTDLQKDLVVNYSGVLPALFREGQGVVIDGHLKDHQFIATRVLAKHDEKYMPPKITGYPEKAGGQV